MDNQKNTGLIWGAALFILGSLIGIVLSTISIWADLEANNYGFNTISGNQLPNLNCPVLMNNFENAIVTLTLSNPSNRQIQPLVRVDISSPGPFFSQRTRYSLEPGETKSIRWTAGAENIVLGNFVLIKVFQYPASILPAREAACGIMVVNLPAISGGQMLVFAIGSSILFMLAGLILLERVNVRGFTRLPNFRRLRLFVVLVLLTMVVGLTGDWLIGGLLLAVVVLAAASIIGGLVLQEK